MNCLVRVRATTVSSAIGNFLRLSYLTAAALFAISVSASGATVDAIAELRAVHSAFADFSTLPPGESPVGNLAVTNTGFPLLSRATVTGDGSDMESQIGVLSFVNGANHDFSIEVTFDFTSTVLITFDALDEEPNATAFSRTKLTRDGAPVDGTNLGIDSSTLPFPRFSAFRIDSTSVIDRFVLGPGEQTEFRGETFASAFAHPVPLPPALPLLAGALGALIAVFRRRQKGTLQVPVH